ncbi:MAG TPA: LysR family transcriptional regulator [Streptosporangiaceae bacterium]|nr:LysR family transcriptional regulator [Streptosporangiaceae bacterium]
MLDVTRLRVLAAVARHGSVTGAARELSYAQPSVSHHLARLEAETGSKLIQRDGRGIRLTDAGRLLAERAAEILGRLDAAENELAAHVGLRHGRVRLAAFPSALGTIVPAAAARLRSDNPGVDLTLAEAEPPEALRMLRAGYVDVAVVFRHELDVGGEGARGVMLLDEPVCLVTRAAGTPPSGTAPSGSPPSGSPPSGLAASGASSSGAPSPGEAPDLSAHADAQWIAGCDRCRSFLLQQCARAGFTPKIAFTTDDSVAVQALVAAGLGVTTLPGLALRAARHPGITAAPLPGARRYVLAMTYGEPPDPAATTQLIDALMAAGRRAMSAPAESPDPSKR